MFDFSSWWDSRCFEYYDLEWDAALDCPARSPDSHRVHFVSKPSPVYLKDSERVYAPWWPSNDWEFKEWKPGDKGKFGIDWESIDFENYINCRREYAD